MFIGREEELTILNKIKAKKTSSLFVCKGRRRIGKSRLVFEYAKGFAKFLEFQGLAPVQGQTNEDQLDNFAFQLARQTKLPQLKLNDWSQAFELLATSIQNEQTLILLDEISWMGAHDNNFAGKLKIIWDKSFSRMNNLVVGLCGSVSTWIEENILNNTNFIGRISTTISLTELTLDKCAKFWGAPSAKFIAPYEKLKFLSVTGGVPRYLEELNPAISAEDNINNLCFKEEGFLFNEMERIFDDSFDSSKKIYKDLIHILEKDHASFSKIVKDLKIKSGGTLSNYLDHLEQSGFVTKDAIWKLDGQPSKSPRFRLSDNYLRFYLRCIKPNKRKISKKIFSQVNFDSFSPWRSIFGLQFENLINSNLKDIVEGLMIDPHHIVSIGPYLQQKSRNIRSGTQIDLLIHTKFDTVFICELKSQKRVSSSVIKEIKTKIDSLERPKYLSIRPVLIYAGELEEELSYSDFFYKMYNIGKLLE